MTLTFINQSNSRWPRQYLELWLKYVERTLRRRKIGGDFFKKDLVLVLMAPAGAKKLNSQFRKKDYATDVLSFSGNEPDVLGELVFCDKVVRKQADEHGLSWRDELAYLTLHGLLHLLGYEHETSKKQAEQMYELQDELFSAIDRIR